MMALIKRVASFLWGNTGLLLALAVVAWIGYQTLRIGGLERSLERAQANHALLQANRDAWQGSSESLARLLVQEVELRMQAQDAIAALSEQLRQADEEVYTPLRQAIRHAPPADDGPVAPVLRAAIAGLP